MNKLNNTKHRIIDIATRKETIGVLLILAFLAAALSSIFVSPRLYRGTIHEGDIALKDVYAPYDFTYFWEIDEERTRKAREDAAGKVPYFLSRNVTYEKKIISEFQVFFKKVKTEETRDIVFTEKVRVLKSVDIGNSLSEKDIRSLLEYEGTFENLQQKVLSVLDNIFLIGYIGSDDYKYIAGKGEYKVNVCNREANVETVRLIEDLVLEHTFRKLTEEYTAKAFATNRKIRQAVVNLILKRVASNLILEDTKTLEERESVSQKVKPVFHSWAVEKNELIVEKGKRVDVRHIAQISQLRRLFRPGVTPTFFFGVLLLFLLLGLIAAIYMSFSKEINLLKSTKELLIVLISVFFMIVLADFISKSPQPSYFIPMAGMGMLLMFLISFSVAFVCVILMSVLISLLVGGGIGVALVLMVGSAVGMFAIKGARRRARIIWAGLLVGTAKFAAISCIGLINGIESGFYIKDGVWGVASGIFSAFIVMGLLPIFEHVFKVPTNISLLELSDMNHPLLKKLAMEAPGTYHHSIMVGNLAESACDAIGANSLLARVGSYYHDIGKMPKAEYFSENEMGSGSRHEKLTPSMSALIIGKHVKEGVEIARKYKLNNAIIGFITQHHGDSLIAYFYQKAIEQSEDGVVLEEDSFRYSGPKPQTKESAIVLLADSVEAASRTLNEPTPSSIRNLVKKLVNNKFIDGQLNECDLTLKDMNKIVDSFVRVLTGIFHTRLDYPENKPKFSNGISSNGSNKQQKSK